MREEVAVGLVLRLTEREVAVPQVRGPGEESQGVGRQVELGVRGRPARRLGEGQREGEGPDEPQPATAAGVRRAGE